MSETASKHIIIRAKPTLVARLQKQAEAENNGIAALARRLLTEGLDREQRVSPATRGRER